MLDMGQNRIRKAINITFDPDLRSEIETHLASLPDKISFSAWVETAAKQRLERDKK